MLESCQFADMAENATELNVTIFDSRRQPLTWPPTAPRGGSHPCRLGRGRCSVEDIPSHHLLDARVAVDDHTRQTMLAAQNQAVSDPAQTHTRAYRILRQRCRPPRTAQNQAHTRLSDASG